MEVWPSGDKLYHENHAIMNGVNDLIKETSEASLAPFAI